MPTLQQLVSGRTEIAAIYLFGSQVTARARPDSDTDVAVLVRPSMWPQVISNDHRWRRRLVVELMDALQTDSIDLVVLNEASPLLVHRVLRDGRMLGCSDPVSRIRFQIAAVAEYLDTLPLREAYLASQQRQLRKDLHGG